MLQVNNKLSPVLSLPQLLPVKHEQIGTLVIQLAGNQVGIMMVPMIGLIVRLMVREQKVNGY